MTERDERDEAPLDSAAERLRRKMVRLLAVSIGTMFVAVMAVLGAVVYKLSQRDAPAAAASAAPLAIDLPAGAVVKEMAAGDGAILLRVREGTIARLLHGAAATGRIVGRYELRRP